MCIYICIDLNKGFRILFQMILSSSLASSRQIYLDLKTESQISILTSAIKPLFIISAMQGKVICASPGFKTFSHSVLLFSSIHMCGQMFFDNLPIMKWLIAIIVTLSLKVRCWYTTLSTLKLLTDSALSPVV